MKAFKTVKIVAVNPLPGRLAADLFGRLIAERLRAEREQHCDLSAIEQGPEGCFPGCAAPRAADDGEIAPAIDRR
ncbi:MAG: hypothetical protein ABL934_03015 [Lysobacteraceae bacterium]